MKMTHDDSMTLIKDMFNKHSVMLSLWQTLAEHFYPERADFTNVRNIGTELSDNLVDSYPILVRRDLGNSFAAMLRQGEWFEGTVQDDTNHAGRMWLQFISRKLHRLMNIRSANFTRATKEGDHDYATFGQCVISVEKNKTANGLLYRNWHLRDVAWADECDGQIGPTVRRWNARYYDVYKTFKERSAPEVIENYRKHPFKENPIYHMVLPAELYGDDRLTERFKFVSVFIDEKNKHELEVVGMNTPYYVIPRFQTVAGSPYAYSPATVAGLPDARALQAMTFTLLEAAERYARPPIIATQKVIRGDVNLHSDGVTWVDDKYDERLGASLRTLQQDRGGFPIGLEMKGQLQNILSSAFYLNKLTLPEVTHEMTAYEVAERMKQFRRENLPLFAPLEADYNGQLCEVSFDIAMNAGMLGSPYDIPDSLQGRDIQWQFQSPLSQSEEEKKANQFSQVAQMLATAAEFDQGAAHNMNFDVALRDAISGIGAPQTWLRSIEEVLESRQADKIQQAMLQAAEMQGVA